jgi:hypothetical protein
MNETIDRPPVTAAQIALDFSAAAELAAKSRTFSASAGC